MLPEIRTSLQKQCRGRLWRPKYGLEFRPSKIELCRSALGSLQPCPGSCMLDFLFARVRQTLSVSTAGSSTSPSGRVPIFPPQVFRQRNPQHFLALTDRSRAKWSRKAIGAAAACNRNSSSTRCVEGATPRDWFLSRTHSATRDSHHKFHRYRRACLLPAFHGSAQAATSAAVWCASTSCKSCRFSACEHRVQGGGWDAWSTQATAAS